MDLVTILFANTILLILGIAIFVAVYRLDKIIKRKLEEKRADRKYSGTHATR